MNFALDRLKALRAARSLDCSTSIDLDNLPLEWIEECAERAAILEYDGGLSREKAEVQALREISERIRDAERI